jgi:hypothetical protein
MKTIAANAHHLDGASLAILGGAVLGVGLIALLVGYALLVIPASMSWNSLKKEHAEVRELQGLGLVTLFTLGIPLAGIWPMMVLNQKKLFNDAQVGDWLRTPVRLWMIAYLVSVAGMVLGSPLREIGYGISGILNLTSMLMLIMGGRKSVDPLIHVTANSYVKICICSLLMYAYAFQFKSHASASLPGLSGFLLFLATTVGGVYYIYHMIKGNLALLAVFRRCLPQGSGNLAGPLFGIGLVVTIISFGLFIFGMAGSIPGLS